MEPYPDQKFVPYGYCITKTGGISIALSSLEISEDRYQRLRCCGSVCHLHTCYSSNKTVSNYFWELGVSVQLVSSSGGSCWKTGKYKLGVPSLEVPNLKCFRLRAPAQCHK